MASLVLTSPSQCSGDGQFMASLVLTSPSQ